MRRGGFTLKIPRKVKVGGIRYEVKMVKAVTDGIHEYAGRCLHRTQVIELDRNAEADSLFDTLLHESLHCLSSVYHLGLTEDEVCSLAPALHAFLKDNKLLRE